MNRFFLACMIHALLIGICNAECRQPASHPDSLDLLFWNLENFFDWKDEGNGPADTEFSASGSRHWTYGRFQAKVDAVGKALMWISGRNGKFPELFAMAEVENARVVKYLKYSTMLGKLPLGHIHFDSPDPRGIDVALLYRKDRLKLLDARPVGVPGVRTRDILCATFQRAGPDSLPRRTLSVLVCHFPSKYGGKAAEPKREAAAATLLQCIDSLLIAGERDIITMGDFNDTPFSPALMALTGEESPLRCLSDSLQHRGSGSIRFEGRWELIDLFYSTISQGRQPEVIQVPFLMTWDNVHAGLKPLRTYSGPRHLGGVSDHCPIFLRIGE